MAHGVVSEMLPRRCSAPHTAQAKCALLVLLVSAGLHFYLQFETGPLNCALLSHHKLLVQRGEAGPEKLGKLDPWFIRHLGVCL